VVGLGSRDDFLANIKTANFDLRQRIIFLERINRPTSRSICSLNSRLCARLSGRASTAMSFINGHILTASRHRARK